MATIGLAACSSGSGGSSAAKSSDASAGLARARAALAKYSSVPEFSDALNHPGPAFNAKKLAGKLVFNINASSTNPFWVAETQGIKEASAAVGARFVDYQNSGKISEWVQGMNQAIAQKASVIILNAQNPNQLKPQIDAAHAAGIKVVMEHLFYPGQAMVGGIDGTAYAPFLDAARLLVDAAIVHTNGHGNVLLLTSDDLLPSPPMRDAMVEELKTNCPACKYKIVNVDSSLWSTEIQTETQSALTSDPTINYIIPIYDPMSEYVVPAVTAKGMKGKVHAATYNGTPFALKYIQEDDVVQVEIAENPAWIGWATMDQALRLMAGLPVAPDEVTPLRIIDSTNVDETGTPPALGKGVGGGYEEAYTKLWGLK